MAIRKSLAKRYSKALLATARTDADLDALAKDFDAVAAAVAQYAELRGVLLSPTVRVAAKKTVVSAVAEKMGTGAHVRRLLDFLVEAHRVDHLPMIVETFREEIDRRRGLVRGEVLAPRALDPAGLANVRGALSKAMGKTVLLTQRLDETLIGGLQVRVGGVIIDGSLRGRLQKLVEQMKG
ncbi:MAG: ATP synthase F1 subunit delta [Deltaproteobacteria bacterium]|nr:ATP synthase F1 subunit delta [Deltaproteobacteria bacterium]